MKPSCGQYGSDIVDSGSPIPRYASQHVTSVPTTGHVGHPVYLTQHQSLPSTHHRGFGSSLSPHGAREYQIHHLPVHAADLPHRSHVPGSAGIGLGPTHASLHIPQRRRTSGHRCSLLWDIGVAGERERDRAESSGNAALSHSYSATGTGTSHVIAGPTLYGSRPNISMMSSMGGLQPQKNLTGSSAASQAPIGTPPRHSTASSGQLSRPSLSASQHPYSSGSSPFMLPGPSTVKSEPGVGAFVKEESKSPMHPFPPHYQPQLLHSQSYPGHTSQHLGSVVKNEPADREVESMPSKESLLQSMDKVDKEINKVTSEIKGLERKQQHLENAAKKPPQTEKSTSPKKVETKHKDLWQVIYAENKKKAEAARGLLDHLCQHHEMPLYNQPCDTDVYKENLKKNEEMRPKLLAYFQRRSQLSNMRERYLCTRYDQLMSEWQKRAEKIENSIKRKSKETKVREFFEKQFPEIRKQRELQERLSRTGTRGDTCRSEADFNDIVDGLSEQENQEQHMRHLAVVPPMLLDRDERRLKFINNNGLVMDPMEDYKKRQELDHWNAQEKQIFKEKYVQHPKNFHVIASFLEKKSVADCVLFYYLSKKSVGYKSLVRKNSLKPRKVKSGRGHAQQSSTGLSQDFSKNGQQSDKGEGYSEQKRESPETVIKEEEIERIDRPPSPRMTRSRNKNLNWTDEDISVAKEGFGKHGKDFAAISRLFSNKTEHQIKNFYHNYKKKHNLDLLISDGKKRKLNEGSRRTRTQVQIPESIAIVMQDDDSTLVDEVRPKSAEPQVSMINPLDASESSKKRKKELEPEKRDELKADEDKKAEGNAISNVEADLNATIPRVTSSSMSQIRTRRSAVVTNSGAETARSQSTKRSSESPVEEPSEKKAKKSKPGKETKLETQEPKIHENRNNEGETMEEGMHKAEVTKDEKTMSSDGVVENIPASNTAISDSVPTITTQSALMTGTALADNKPVASSEFVDNSLTQSIGKKSPVAETEKVEKMQHFSSGKVETAGNDGDSSATCSADEEPNMQDIAVESKSAERKHADSPYAFDDDSSTSIKLESSRSPLPPILTHTPPIMKDILRPTVTQINTGRPASTHPPQPAILPRDQKRPQSLPPPPGAIGPANVPISALSFHPALMQRPGDSRPNSTPNIFPTFPLGIPIKGLQTPPWPYAQHRFTGHIVGKVPEENEFRSALQNIHVPPVMPKKPSSTYSDQTIDLTVSSTGGRKTPPSDSVKFDKESVQRLPHYHPVPHEAASMQKDFSSHKIENITKEDMPTSRQRKYTPTEIASMHERAAVIPVSSLRVPMPGPQSREKLRMEHPAKKENHHPIPGMGGPSRPLLIQQQPVLVQPATSLARPYLTTSSIATKFVSGTMTSGAPVRHIQPPKPQATSETRRPDVITPGQRIDPASTRRSPALEAAMPPQTMDSRNYHDLSKLVHPGSRTTIVKPVAADPTILVHGHDGVNRKEAPPMKGYPGIPNLQKSAPGSITTGLPIHRAHDDRQEPRTELRSDIIAGRQILVKYPHLSPLPDPTRLQDADRHPHGLQFPPPTSVIHPTMITGLPSKSAPAPGPGSILAGTPVKRKASEESNSSLSPLANPSPYLGIPRPSPTISPPLAKHQDRGGLSSGSGRSPIDIMRSTHPVYHYITREKLKKEDIFPVHRQTPEHYLHEAQSGVTSPIHRQTPTAMSQHPLVKQETPGSPHTTEELFRRGNFPISFLDSHHLNAAAAASQELARLPPAGFSQLPLHVTGAANPDLLEIWRQYGRAASLAGSQMIPMFLPHLSYPPGLMPPLNLTGSPIAPGSPQNDDSREKMLNQDFQTAKIMQLRKPVPGTVAVSIPGFSLAGAPTMTTPGMGVPPLVVSGATPYHALATTYHPGLPVDRLSFIPSHPALPRSPFASQYAQHSGRSSSDNSYSPLQKPMKSASPDVLRQRHRSGEMPREFTSHQVVKGRSSPASPYHSPHGNLSPRERVQPQGSHSQLSPAQPSQRSYHRYLQPGTPPGQSPHHYMTKSPHIPPGLHHPYPRESRSSPYLVKHNRSGSLDETVQPRLEKPRPDSAGPRSLPQSPNEGHKQPTDYRPNVRRDSLSPKYHREVKPEFCVAPGIAREMKVQPLKDERGLSRRESPRPIQKIPIERGDGRTSQPHVLPGGSYQVRPMVQQRQDNQSPLLQQRPKEVIESQSQKDSGHLKVDAKPEPEHLNQRMSKNPGEDLKLCGRAKMKAATLIDHIININFDVNHHQSKTPDPIDRVQKQLPHQKPPVSSRMQHPAQSKQAMTSGPGKLQDLGQPNPGPSKPPRFEAESKHSPTAPSAGYLVQSFPLTQYVQPMTGVPTYSGTQPSKNNTVPRGMTLAEHSADVINECYRKTATEKSASPAQKNLSHSSEPATAAMVTEPISPPEKRALASHSDPKLTLQEVYSQFQQQRFPTPSTGVAVRPRQDLPAGDPRPLSDTTRSLAPPQMAQAVSAGIPMGPGSSQLEDIIRKALMSNESPVVTHTEQPTPSSCNDLILQHAFVSAMSAPRPKLVQTQEEQKKSSSAAQSRNGSEKYMSALMFRAAPSQAEKTSFRAKSLNPKNSSMAHLNTPPSGASNLPHERQQQFYQGSSRPSHAASHSPAPQDSNLMQPRTVLPMPQYEALSDSD